MGGLIAFIRFLSGLFFHFKAPPIETLSGEVGSDFRPLLVRFMVWYVPQSLGLELGLFKVGKDPN